MAHLHVLIHFTQFKACCTTEIYIASVRSILKLEGYFQEVSVFVTPCLQSIESYYVAFFHFLITSWVDLLIFGQFHIKNLFYSTYPEVHPTSNLILFLLHE